MTSDLTLLVRSRNGTARMLADLAHLRAADLGLTLTVLDERDSPLLASSESGESVTAIVPVDFAGTHHEAWCLLCQLSLMRREVNFAILVLGAQGCAEFTARQKALLSQAGRAPHSTRSERRSQAA